MALKLGKWSSWNLPQRVVLSLGLAAEMYIGASIVSHWAVEHSSVGAWFNYGGPNGSENVRPAADNAWAVIIAAVAVAAWVGLSVLIFRSPDVGE